MKETRRALGWSLGLLLVCGPFVPPAATDIAATFDEAWALYENIARARTTLWVWEKAYEDRHIDLADPMLIYLDMYDTAYGEEERKAGLRTVVTTDKEELLRNVKLTFAGLSRADFKKGLGEAGQLPPGAEEFTMEKAIVERDKLIEHYMNVDARIRETEENSLSALKVGIAELKTDIGEMEKELAALFEGPEEPATVVAPRGGTPGPGPQKRFEHPRRDGAYVDNCLKFAQQCGAPAAHKFCTLLHFSGAAAWDVDLNDSQSQHQRTVVLGEEETVNGKRNPKRICSPTGAAGTTKSPSGKCVGFKYIECK